MNPEDPNQHYEPPLPKTIASNKKYAHLQKVWDSKADKKQQRLDKTKDKSDSMRAQKIIQYQRTSTPIFNTKIFNINIQLYNNKLFQIITMQTIKLLNITVRICFFDGV